MRHMRIADLYVKEALRTRLQKTKKLRTDENGADVHTKYYLPEPLRKWKQQHGYVHVCTLAEHVKTEMRQVSSTETVKRDTAEYERRAARS